MSFQIMSCGMVQDFDNLAAAQARFVDPALKDFACSLLMLTWHIMRGPNGQLCSMELIDQRRGADS